MVTADRQLAVGAAVGIEQGAAASTAAELVGVADTAAEAGIVEVAARTRAWVVVAGAPTAAEVDSREQTVEGTVVGRSASRATYFVRAAFLLLFKMIHLV